MWIVTWDKIIMMPLVDESLFGMYYRHQTSFGDSLPPLFQQKKCYFGQVQEISFWAVEAL